MADLPEQVKQQIDIGKQMIDQLQKAAQGQAAEPAPEPEPEPEQEPEPAEPESESEPEPEPEPEPEGDEGLLAEPDDGKWEQRYKTLKGKYNREITTLREENAQLRALLEHLNTQVQQLQAQVQTARPKETPAAQPATPSQQSTIEEVLDKYRSQFDEETLSLVREATLAAVKEVQGHLQPLESSLQSTRQQLLVSTLNSRIPGWEAQNRDPEFLNWLNQPVAGAEWTGLTYQSLLQNAYQAVTSAPSAEEVQRGLEGIVSVFQQWPGRSKYEPKPAKPAAPRRQTALTTQAAPPPSAAPAPAEPKNSVTYSEFQRLMQERAQLAPKLATSEYARKRHQQLVELTERLIAENRIVPG